MENGHVTTIDDIEISFPMTVDDAAQATLMFTVPLAAAQALIPGDAFVVAEASTGMATFIMALVDYTANPWGDYNEVNLGVLVHPTDRPDEVNAFVYRMPVDQEFTMKAGTRVLGLPKVVTDISVERTDRTVRFQLDDGGEMALAVTIPVPDTEQPEPAMVDTVTYSYLDGVPQELPLSMQVPPHLIDPAAVRIELGLGDIADELTTLGLPTAPDLCLWGERLHATFEAPRPIGAS